ncbi:MAG: NosD domain-containing protein [Candidatus Woesearchaeota archaeon]
MGIFVLLLSAAYAAEYDCSSCDDCNSTIQEAVSGDVISLTQDISKAFGRCIEIGLSGITLDCHDHTIGGLGNQNYRHEGIHVTGNDNTIQNCNIEGFLTGVNLEGADDNTITSITSTGSETSLFLNQGSGNTIENSVLDNLKLGLSQEIHCSNIIENVLDTENKPFEFITETETIIEQEFSSLILCDADGAYLSSIETNLLSIYYTDNSDLSGITTNGMSISHSANIVLDNIESVNSGYGIFISDSDNVLISNTVLSNNQWAGIRLNTCTDIVIRDSEITDNDLGFFFSASDEIKIFNNRIGNIEETYSSHSNSDIYWNTTLDPSERSITGGWLGGNYWEGFSETCDDINEDGICDSSYELDYLPLTDYEVVCETSADTDGNNKIDMEELMAYIILWKQGNISMPDLMRAIAFWKAGVGC